MSMNPQGGCACLTRDMKRNRILVEATLPAAGQPSLAPIPHEPVPVLGLVPPVSAEEPASADVTGSAWFEFICVECGYGALFAGAVVDSCSRCAAYAWVRARARSPRPMLSAQVPSIGPAQDARPGQVL